MEITLEQVGKQFDTVAAVRGITLTVHSGEFLTLLGPSGCGKTTILRLIAGLERPDRGHVRFDGQVVDDVPPEARGVGLVFQNYALFPHMTVAQNIAYGLRAGRGSNLRRGADRVLDRVRQLLELVGLPGYERRYPAQLSAGQQQRVAIARALAPEPRAVLLDEPLSALDARLRDRLRLEIRRLQQQLGLTMVYVTHDQTEALSMSDRIAVLREGRLEQVGTPAEIYDQPVNPFVATFVGDANLIAVDGAVYVVRPERLRVTAVQTPAGVESETWGKAEPGLPAGGTPPATPTTTRPEGKAQAVPNASVSGLATASESGPVTASESGPATASVSGLATASESGPATVSVSGPVTTMDGTVQLTAQVIGSEYLGATTRLHLRWGEQELVVQQGEGVALGPGTWAHVSFDRRQAVQMPLL